MTYTGLVNHTMFDNKLIEVAKGKRNSWNFTFADATAGRSNGRPSVSSVDTPPLRTLLPAGQEQC